MSAVRVTMVRVYLTEAHKRLEKVVRYLHDESPVRGITVFRGIEGFGHPGGKIHGASLLDLSLDLPVVVEFFDAPERASPIVERLNEMLEPGHVVYWDAWVDGLPE